MEKELPEGWVLTNLEMLFSLKYGKGLATKELLAEGYPVYGANGVIGRYRDFMYDNAKVIISCRGAASGAIHKTVPKSFVTSNSIILDEKDQSVIDIEFAKYAMINADKSSIITGTAQPQITIQLLKYLPFPLAPVSEQKIIANKLDTLFGHLDALREKLDRIPPLLQNFRQQVLTQAVTGKLTEEWRGSEELVDWEELQVSQIGKVTGGLTKNAKRRDHKLKLPYLRVANVYANELRLEEILEIGLTEKEFERTALKTNDLLVVEGNGSPDQIGRVALWDGTINPCVHQNHLIKIRFTDGSMAKYTLLYLLSPLGRNQIKNVSVSTSGLYTLSIGKVSKLAVNLPPQEEQQEIVRRVEGLFSAADALEARYQKLKAQIDALPQAILAKAFKGELLPQNREDEPAGVLLERIKGERGVKL
ncbi:MAG TPA: hypothetical protein DIU20_07540 [Cryomorphaceae bacterium]|nr:hypothetical protein [Owenweeksia sp.]HCQ16096.1 hypothetical protein [Cryomorphaceae bacterium]|tara:strand:+ start:11286 stop:12545 length:1260 start_codon:yes stop_codon:yes gene_type:complete